MPGLLPLGQLGLQEIDMTLLFFAEDFEHMLAGAVGDAVDVA